MTRAKRDVRPMAVFNAGPFRASKDGFYDYAGGDNDVLFADTMQIAREDVIEVRVQDDDCRYPDADEIAGVVVSGSASMVTDRHPWSERTAQWIADNDGKLPILGVCFGHQIVAHGLGGDIAWLPGPSEYGTGDIRLEPGAASDPLFMGIPDVFQAQIAHSQTVTKLPKGAKLLATNRFGVQAARMSKTSWGVQFHPEYDAGIMRVLFDGYPEYIEGRGVDVARERAGLRETPLALQALRNFAALVKARMKVPADA
ncbi:MAG: glutamine amidotransferase [Hyphomicrobiaceae bacterium]